MTWTNEEGGRRPEGFPATELYAGDVQAICMWLQAKYPVVIDDTDFGMTLPYVVCMSDVSSKHTTSQCLGERIAHNSSCGGKPATAGPQ